ncbi:MAG TPA: hypothetical protein DDW49_07430 [Deltaproteobacteria bacterium]|nr:hypothetical protein [Deltaproteobacteria bacterium]
MPNEFEALKNKILLKLLPFRKPLLISIDLITTAFAWWLSWNLTTLPDNNSWLLFAKTSLVALALTYGVQLLIFKYAGLYRALLSYASFRFGITILKAVTLTNFLICLGLKIIFPELPWRLFLINWLLTLSLTGFTRYLPRFFAELTQKDKGSKKKVLIYGAGDVGDAVARSILKDKIGIYQIIGFIDDNQRKIGLKVHNLPILGSKENLGGLIQKYKIDEIIVSMSNYPAESLRTLVKECRTYHVFCRMAPTLPGMISENISLKNIDVTDLLKRNPEDLDEKQIEKFITGKKVLISGAAGSIGSELVRQCLQYKAAFLFLVDISEYGLYNLREELMNSSSKYHTDPLGITRFILLDLCDKEPIDHLIAKEKPDLILHAAAYKHVPMMEANPFTGVSNNVVGTMNIATSAHEAGVEKFVLISTDKAVRPTNIMGATKRICELFIQNLNLTSKTEYIAVRFGNVLGSSGSVIPKFLSQIAEGGPVTVTHPDVVRYFMLIQEAVELTLQAASLGHGGEIFILNMGKPVKIKEMAEDLIFLAGKEPYKDIDIQFTGLRPGEKLYEELLLDEAEKKTQYENITIGKMTFIDWATLNNKIDDILLAIKYRDYPQLLLAIQSIMPEFQHLDLPQFQPDNVINLRKA